MDLAKHTVTLPKIVDWYAGDFDQSGAPAAILSSIMALVPRASRLHADMSKVLQGDRKPIVKFAPYEWACHESLRQWRPDDAVC